MITIFNKQGITIRLVILFLGLLLIACDSPSSDTAKNSNTAKSAEAKIIKWDVSTVIVGATSDITQDTITITVPFETKINPLAVKPTISSRAKIISDLNFTSGKEKDFIIEAEDGTRKTYQVTVKVSLKNSNTAKSAEAKIIKWDVSIVIVGATISDITQDTITITVPFETKIDPLVVKPTISSRAKIISDLNFTSGKEKDFIIEAEDGTRKTYQVTVKVSLKNSNTAKSAEAKIIKWDVSIVIVGATISDITQDTITITVPFETKIDPLVVKPIISSRAKIISDLNFTSGQEKNFIIEAEDGTQKIYTVKVVSLPGIKSFNFGNAKDTVVLDHSKGEITVGLEYTADTTDITRLKATLTLSDKASITSTFDPSKKGADYHKTYQTPKEVTVSAEDGQTTQTYKIKVQIKVSDANRFDVVYKEIERMGGKIGEEFTGDLNHLDMSAVSNMKNLFSGDKDRGHYELARKFNGNISKWEVGNVRDMSGMFYAAKSFNQDIFEWKVENVTNMRAMFVGAISFNQDISEWDVENVKNMSYMFYAASKFNQNISKWKVGNVRDMSYMFKSAVKFNQDLRKWDTSKVLNCKDFSNGATVYINKADKPQKQAGEATNCKASDW